MNEYLAKLTSAERRFVVGMVVLVFVVLNAVFIWPHFNDWGAMGSRLENARTTLLKFQNEIANDAPLKLKVQKLENEGAAVPAEEQAIDFLRTIQSQAAQSGIMIQSSARQPERTNQWFLERSQGLTIQSTESNLVNFLYELGAGNSLIRVRGLSLRPDTTRMQLNANVTLVASYQKKTTRPASNASTPAPPGGPSARPPIANPASMTDKSAIPNAKRP